MNVVASKVFFLKAPNNPTKLRHICELVKSTFLNGKKILIIVPSDEAAAYIDQLLWSTPEESFIPHKIAQAAINERVVITKSLANINQAECVLNLSSQALNQMAAQTIYEFYDQTHPDKEALSQKRLETYQSLGMEISHV